MANIVIKDLTESIDLDRKAMLAVIGGARSRGRQPLPAQAFIQSTRIVNFGFTRGPVQGKNIEAK